jgi:hypothetical protein
MRHDTLDVYDQEYLARAKSEKADFVIVVCDTFSYENYPVFVTKNELEQKKNYYNNQSMQRV